MRPEITVNRRRLLQVTTLTGVAAFLTGCGVDYAKENSQLTDKRELEANHVLGADPIRNEQSGFSLRHPTHDEAQGLFPKAEGRDVFLGEGTPVEFHDDDGEPDDTKFYPYFYSWTDGTRGVCFQYPKMVGSLGQQDSTPNTVLVARPRDASVDGGIVIFSKGDSSYPFQIERVLNAESNQEKIRFTEMQVS